VAGYGGLAALSALAAYWLEFTQFALYDDEGTVLTTLLLFKQGQPLYRDIVTQYGPFYFELYGGLSVLTGHELTHDVGRLLVVAEWTATSLLIGVACERLSGSLLLGLGGMASAFGVLDVLVAEPLHPVSLTVLLVAIAALVLTGPLSGRRAAAPAALLGFALAALTLTKVNLGGFALAALALAAAFAWPPLAARRAFAWLVAAGFVAMPLALVASDLGSGAIRRFAFLMVGASGAVVAAAAGLRERAQPQPELTPWLRVAALAFAGTAVASLVAILLTGPSLADVYDGMVVEARRTRDALMTPLVLPKSGVWWAVASLAGALAAVRLRRIVRVVAVWPALGRILVGAGMWLTVAESAPFAFGAASTGLEPAIALAWVAAVPPAGEERVPSFARIALPALAIAQTLQVYPIAGSQVGAAKLLFIPVGALCLGDGLRQLHAWAEARGGHLPIRCAFLTPVAAAALAATLVWTLMLQPGREARAEYANQVPLPLHGAQRIHLKAEDVDTYTRLVALLRQRCSALAGYPSVNSLYLWSRIEPARGGLPGAWMYLLTADRQQRVVDELRRAGRPCAIRNRLLEFFWLRGRPVPDGPLVKHIVDDYRPVADVNGYQLLLPKRATRSARPIRTPSSPRPSLGRPAS
jgi:hypothetical protein